MEKLNYDWRDKDENMKSFLLRKEQVKVEWWIAIQNSSSFNHLSNFLSDIFRFFCSSLSSYHFVSIHIQMYWTIIVPIDVEFFTQILNKQSLMMENVNTCEIELEDSSRTLLSKHWQCLIKFKLIFRNILIQFSDWRLQWFLFKITEYI